ncbi:hypothetical protein F5884DRAFT_898824 [Xylogone sp. PMI_703]|nr:hypothetical protein F5884DRAFT_898824 [Xylogone sp. PMI_703]
MVRFPASLALLIDLALCAPSVVQPRVDDNTFGLYAYGPNIGGFPVFSLDDHAYVGVPDFATSSNNETGQHLYFTLSDSTLTAYPNTTTNDSSSISSSGATLIVESSSGSQFRFNSNDTNPSGAIASGWKLYGGIILLNINDTFVDPIYAVATSTAGVWTLNWNVSEDASAIPVSIKNSPPSAPPSVN